MKNYLPFALACIFMITACDDGNTSDPADKRVVIDGITWATRNTGEPGELVANPDDNGDLYTFEEAQTACPEGWRVPTADEFKSLADSGYEWETTANGVEGVRFGSGKSTIFLPKAGFRSADNDEIYYSTGGRYWSHTEEDDTYGYSMSFTLSPLGLFLHVSNHNDAFLPYKANEFSVRCVKK